MSPSDTLLLTRWEEQRDPGAFQELVARHGGMVYAACSRILRNAADAEEVAQECFLALAESKARDIRTLGGWLHTLATRRSLDRLRSDHRRHSREQRYSEAKPGHVEPTWNDIQQFVDEAIATLPEHLGCVVVDHFLEGRTQADIAQSFDLSPSAISRRVDTAVKHIRDSLEKRGVVTGATALTGVLATGSSEALPKSLAGTLAKVAIAGARRVVPRTVPSGSVVAFSPLFAKLMPLALFVALIGGIGFSVLNRPSDPVGEGPLVAAPPVSSTDSLPVAEATNTEVLASTDAQLDVAEAAFAINVGGSISGVVVFRDSGEPAEGMRVTLGRDDDDDSLEFVTDADGAFAFSELDQAELVLIAYDARHPEVPRYPRHSKPVKLKLAQGESKEGIRIEVPPLGGEISGRVVDAKTGAPLAGIIVDAGRVGVASYTAKTDGDGRYTILGLSEGEWRVSPDRQNPIFAINYVHDMEMVQVRKGETTRLDLAVERTESVSGQVVDSEGRPVSEAWVDAVLFLGERNERMSCYTKADAQGRFTIWGRTGGERITLNARKRDELMSSTEVVKMIAGESVNGVLLTLYPATKVSGRFVDEDGRTVEAVFWRRATHPDGHGQWNGMSRKPGNSFEVSLGRGTYEIKGQAKGHDFGAEELTQTIEVGATDIADLVVKIRTDGANTGQYTLRGTVVDENGKPLRESRVYMDGTRSFQETHTDAQGRFAFDGLMDARYRVHATPDEPFEKFSGFDGLNPADTPDVTIVVGRAGIVRGRVLDARTEEPITNFRAEFGSFNPNDPVGRERQWDQKKITSETGLFKLSMRLDEDWYARIAADGYASVRHTGSALGSGQVVEGVDFRLSPSRVVRGTVTTTDGAPVAGALVYHDETVFDVTRRTEKYATAKTDSDGAFTLQSLPAEAQFVYVRKRGFAIAQKAIADEVHVVLTEGGVIEGRVLVGGVVPHEKTNVMATDLDDPRSNFWGLIDENGSYRIKELMDGPYRLSVILRDDAGNHSGSFSTEDPIEAVDGLTTTFDISILTGVATLKGAILLDGTPVPDYHFIYGFGGYLTSGHTDETGHYQLENLPAGPVKIVMLVGNAENPLKPSYETIGEVDIEAGVTAHQDFDLSKIE